MAEPGRVTAYDINPQHLADLIEAVRSKRKIEAEGRARVESAHERLSLAVDSRSAAEHRLFDYVSALADGERAITGKVE